MTGVLFRVFYSLIQEICRKGGRKNKEHNEGARRGAGVHSVPGKSAKYRRLQYGLSNPGCE